MQLLIVRHAIAEEREVFAATGLDDSQRPLVERGRRRMRQGARGLCAVLPAIDVVGTSPYVRAAETAAIIGDIYGVSPTEVDALVPGGDHDTLLRWLQKHEVGSTVAVVGHEPDLGFLASWLLTDSDRHFVELKKGAVCLLNWESHPTAGAAVLEWYLTPRQLRQLGKIGTPDVRGASI